MTKLEQLKIEYAMLEDDLNAAEYEKEEAIHKIWKLEAKLAQLYNEIDEMEVENEEV